jgi:hypothetical protein
VPSGPAKDAWIKKPSQPLVGFAIVTE